MITFRKREVTGDRKREYYIVLCGELALKGLWTCHKTTYVVVVVKMMMMDG